MDEYRVLVVIFIFVSVCLNQCKEQVPGTSRDERLNFTAFGHKYGHPVEEYEVATQDGYILKLFHIAGDSKRPVLLMHGVIDSADTFIIRGKGSLAVALADRGYDVWVGNSRGNRYSRRHATLNPDRDKSFWDFSFHETGYYDLPAIIDFVLLKTSQTALSAIGHSQGNTIFHVLGSTRPEYNSKIKIMIALSPVCFLSYPKLPVRTLITLGPILNIILKSLGQEEIFGDKSALKTSMEAICNHKYVGYKICAHGIFFLLGGSDPAEVEPEFFPVVVAHYPTSTSRKNVLHLLQIANSRTFSQYDDRFSRNLELYQSVRPVKYDLNKVKMRVAMLFGENDGVSSLEDVRLLRESLPNVVEYRQIEHKKFNHLDAVWGRNMEVYLFPSIFEILEKYNTTVYLNEPQLH